MEETALPLTELIKLLQLSSAGKLILLLDTNRDRFSYPPTQSLIPSQTASLEQQLREKLNSDSSLVILCASSPEQGAYDIDALQQGTLESHSQLHRLENRARSRFLCPLFR
ncbi:hypothetical protein [Merismopedia glauca]|uniref:hypothetical protein n=1 Tax=Merismopedia glauca TaxID=292586 RepID=UPI0011B25595|nr:hypothetical protein [Merismopedia glauca]